jgi:hypothetical protein
MRRLVFCIVILIAIFAAVRAYTQGTGTRGVELSPGLVEVTGSQGSLSLAFGLAGGTDEGKWNILPLRIVYTSKDANVSLSLNGLTFLLANGVRVGKPVMVGAPVKGDVVSVGGKVTVASAVDGDVWTFGADIVLGAGSYVTGSVVAVGGKVLADPRARVAGAVQSLPALKLPYLSVLATKASAPVVELIRELLGLLLGALVLFLISYFAAPHVTGIAHTVTAEWRRSLLILALSLVAVPVLVFLLVVSVYGVFFLPFLAVALLAAAFFGFIGISVRLGAVLRKAQTLDSPLIIFTSGLLGLFLIRLPAFAGIALSIVKSGITDLIGQILRVASVGLALAGMVYGMGCALSYCRARLSGR